MIYQTPKRTFEHTGYVNPEKSYHVELDRVMNWNNQDMKTMVDVGRYFFIFSPSQSGKTTFFKMFAQNLETDLNYIFILISFENCKNYDLEQFYKHIEHILYNQLIQRLKDIQCDSLDIVQSFLNDHTLNDSYAFYMLFSHLNQLIRHKKIVIFIDEFDGIPLHEISNFLTTLRKLYQEYKDKKEKALYSIGLVGVRNITQLTVGGVSPFNIADHLELPPFSIKNIRDLYRQYTQETNQAFTDDAVQTIYEETQGQPWLVNRIGSIAITKVKPETTQAITDSDIGQAIDILLEENNMHFDNLYQKLLLYQGTFKKIMTEEVPHLPDDPSQSFLRQYGLIKNVNKRAVISNPIYQKRFQSFDTNQFVTANHYLTHPR